MWSEGARNDDRNRMQASELCREKATALADQEARAYVTTSEVTKWTYMTRKPRPLINIAVRSRVRLSERVGSRKLPSHSGWSGARTLNWISRHCWQQLKPKQFSDKGRLDTGRQHQLPPTPRAPPALGPPLSDPLVPQTLQEKAGRYPSRRNPNPPPKNGMKHFGWPFSPLGWSPFSTCRTAIHDQDLIKIPSCPRAKRAIINPSIYNDSEGREVSEIDCTTAQGYRRAERSIGL